MRASSAALAATVATANSTVLMSAAVAAQPTQLPTAAAVVAPVSPIPELDSAKAAKVCVGGGGCLLIAVSFILEGWIPYRCQNSHPSGATWTFGTDGVPPTHCRPDCPGRGHANHHHQLHCDYGEASCKWGGGVLLEYLSNKNKAQRVKKGFQ